MFLLFFLLWLLLSGGVSMHICLWGLAVSAVITWFCRRVLGYDWHILLEIRGSCGRWHGILHIWWRRCSRPA